jgi:hypothetical protein
MGRHALVCDLSALSTADTRTGAAWSPGDALLLLPTTTLACPSPSMRMPSTKQGCLTRSTTLRCCCGASWLTDEQQQGSSSANK